MTLTLENKERIALEYGYYVVCWTPLEIEDSNGFVYTEPSSSTILTRVITDYLSSNTIEQAEDKITYDPDTELEAIRSFHQKFGFLDSGRTPTMLTKRKLTERAECIQEELDEFKLAIESQDFAEQADALIDLVYFAKGTAIAMGLPWEELFADVQRANISKERGITKRGHAFDVIKPEGWVKPNGVAILAAAGFDKSKFETDGVVDESKCLDDAGRQVFHIDVGDIDPEVAKQYITNAIANSKKGD